MNIHRAKSYIWHLLTAKTQYYIHSPFLYEICKDVIYDKRVYYAFERIEKLRQELLESTTTISVTDFGAGSRMMPTRDRRVSDIARYAAATSRKGQLLFKLVNYFQPKYMLEIGSSLGISTAYQASAHIFGHVVALEGCPQTATIARQNWQQLNLSHIELVEGDFGQTLPQALQALPQLDYVFIDGNHRKQPTLDYFEQCLARSHEQTVLVLDDIHWSVEMEEAWQAIQQHSQVRVTLDLYDLGIVFLHSTQAKEHFKLYFF